MNDKEEQDDAFDISDIDPIELLDGLDEAARLLKKSE
jgi:hypothetical protein